MKIGARIRVTVLKTWVSMTESHPYQHLFRQVYDDLVRRCPIPLLCCPTRGPLDRNGVQVQAGQRSRYTPIVVVQPEKRLARFSRRLPCRHRAHYAGRCPSTQNQTARNTQFQTHGEKCGLGSGALRRDAAEYHPDSVLTMGLDRYMLLHAAHRFCRRRCLVYHDDHPFVVFFLPCAAFMKTWICFFVISLGAYLSAAWKSLIALS